MTLTVSLGLAGRGPRRARPGRAGRSRTGSRERAAARRSREQAVRATSKAGRVISTDAAAGDEVECKSTVTLLVSKGANLITLPDLIGDQQEVAEVAARATSA